MVIDYLATKEFVYNALMKSYTDKVLVERIETNKQGTTYRHKHWVNPDQVKKGDIILRGHHNLPAGHEKKLTPLTVKNLSQHSREVVAEFSKQFEKPQDIIGAMVKLDIPWKKQTHAGTNLMWAKMGLRAVIDSDKSFNLMDEWNKVKDLSEQPAQPDSAKPEEQTTEQANTKSDGEKPDTFSNTEESNQYFCGNDSFDGRLATDGTPYREFWDKTIHYERDAIHRYTCHSSLLNGWLRGFIAAKRSIGRRGVSQLTSFTRLVEHMENAIKKFTLPTPITVHRYMESTPSLLKQFTNADEFVEHAFMSTSTLSSVDPELVKKFKTGLSEPIHLEIDVPKGSGNGMYIAPMSRYQNQCEFLIGRGARLKIDKTEHKDGVFHVKCHLVGFEKRDLNTLKTQ